MTDLPYWLEQREEIYNSLTHFIGGLLCIPGFIFLMISAIRIGDISLIIGYFVFGLSLNILYWVSTIYHWIDPKKYPKYKLIARYGDHISIYILIAGTYTPLTLITLKGTTGYILLTVIWSIALIGTIIKILHFDGFYTLALFFYIGMGWVVVFSMKDLIQSFSQRGIYWLVSGGLFYTIGTYFFAKDEKIPYFHAVWHFYVLLGSICHYIVIYFYCWADAHR